MVGTVEFKVGPTPDRSNSSASVHFDTQFNQFDFKGKLLAGVNLESMLKLQRKNAENDEKNFNLYIYVVFVPKRCIGD